MISKWYIVTSLSCILISLKQVASVQLEVFQVTKGKQHELKDALKNIMHQSPHQTETENAAASVLQVSGSKWVGSGAVATEQL